MVPCVIYTQCGGIDFIRYTPSVRSHSVPPYAVCPPIEEMDVELQQERIRKLRAHCANLRILSTLPFTKTAFWAESVETLAPRRNFLSRFTERAGIPDISVLFKLIA